MWGEKVTQQREHKSSTFHLSTLEDQSILRRLQLSVQLGKKVHVPKVQEEVSKRSLLLRLEDARESHQSPWGHIAAPLVAHHMMDVYASYPPTKKVGVSPIFSLLFSTRTAMKKCES